MTYSNLSSQFYFIRHGQTDANLKNLWCGGGWDLELNQNGIQQAKNLSSMVNEKLQKIDQIYCSPMKRATQTLDVLLPERPIPVSYIDNFKEWHVGDLERTPFQSHLFHVDIDEWPEPPNGEAKTKFISRVQIGLYKVLSSAKSPLIVAHGAVGRVILHLLEIPNTEILNTTLYHFQSESNKKWKLGKF